jgi:hypothetical protein
MDYLRLKILVDTAGNSDPDSRYKLGRWYRLCRLTRWEVLRNLSFRHVRSSWPVALLER